MHRIIVEGPTPHETIATMVALSAPHILLRAQPLGDGGAPAASEPAPQPPQAVTQQPSDDGSEAVALTSQPPAEPVAQASQQQAESSAPRRGRGRPKKTTAISVIAPDGSTKEYETAGEAIEAMADMLDLCETTDEVVRFVGKNQAVVESGAEAGHAFLKIVDEHVAEMNKKAAVADAEPADDLMPKGDTVGAKPEPEKPAEMSLDDDLEPPAFLKKSKPPQAEVKLEDARFAFLAYCKAKDATQGRLLLDGYKVARVGELDAGLLGKFVTDCQLKSGMKDTEWATALAEAAQIAAKK